MNYLKKVLLISVAAFLFILPVNHSLAAPNLDSQDEAFAINAGMDGEYSVSDIIGTVIKTFLSLLGIIFVGLMVYAGYNWMTAAGEEEKVTKAKDTIRRAIIGLVITLAAYAITYFVFTNLPATGQGGGTGATTSGLNN